MIEADYTNRLGFLKMPPGYRLLLLDGGHFFWERECDEVESCIHWNRWVVRKWAWTDYAECKRQQGEA